ACPARLVGPLTGFVLGRRRSLDVWSHEFALLPKVAANEWAPGNNRQPFGSGRLQTNTGQQTANASPPKRLRNFGGQKYEGIRSPLVLETRRGPADGDFESARLAVIADDESSERVAVKSNARLNSIGRRIAGGKGLLERFVQSVLAVATEWHRSTAQPI